MLGDMRVPPTQYLDDFNMSSSKEMKLVFFMDAIEHVSSKIGGAGRRGSIL